MLPRHPKARYLLESGLFNDLTRFTELEARIQTLKDPDEQQAAFGLFAEGILTSRSLHRASEIWPTAQIPLDVRRRLGLPASLPGTDGIFRSLEGEIHAYQLLLRPNRDQPTPEETERFLPLLTNTIQPLLFTNSDVLPTVWQKSKNFHCIKGVDLDRLEPRIFQTLRRWLQGAGAAIERPVIPPHHVTALEKIQTLLANHEQATLLLPPGSEPELLTLRIIQRLGGRRVVVVVLPDPDALIHTVRLWRIHAGWGDLAALQLTEETTNTHGDLDFPLTHHQDGVRRFLTWHHTGLRVILATNNTLPLLSRALIGSPQPDLAITLGIPCLPLLTLKRLCLGTLQHHAHPLLANPSTVTLSLSRPWCLLLLPVTTQSTEPPKTLVPTLMNQVRNLETIRHVHLHLPALPDLSEITAEHLAPGQEPCMIFHLTDEQAKKITERDRCLTAFSRAKRAILVHTIPMAWGKYLPPADLLIPLVSPGPKHMMDALTPILTPTPTPMPGIILLPLFLKDGMLASNTLLWNILQGLRDLDGSLADLLKTSMEQLGREGCFEMEPWLKRIKLAPGATDLVEDPQVLEQAIVTACLHQMGNPWDQRFGELQKYCQRHEDGAIPNSWPENPGLAEWATRQRKARTQATLSPDLSAQLESVGFVWDLEAFAWEKSFQRMEQWIVRHRHGKLPEQNPEDPQLAEWTLHQRLLKKKEKLNPERLGRLEAAGFVWDLEEASWNESLQLFLKFKQHRGHGKIPTHFPDDPALGKWAEKQRKEFQQGRLSSERREKLDAEGFVWDLAVAAWEEMLEVLRQHREHHGHGKVPKDWPANPMLAIWAEEQRRQKDKGILSTERSARLDAIDFVWDLKQARWEEGFLQFLEFKTRTGHGKVPDPCLDSPVLDQWTREMRRSYRLDQLTPELKIRLEEAGLVLDLEVATWNDRYAELVRFRELHGHVVVVEPCADFPMLPAWVQTQRRARIKGTLSEESIQRLDVLDFIWDIAEKHWNDMFHALTLFHATQGHFNVPREWSDPPELSGWVKSLRMSREKEKLDEEKIARLVELGFIWDPVEAAWEEMMLALTRFQRDRHHCLVPAQWPHHPGLARWVEQQRRDYRLKLLKPDKIERLEALGFIWDAKTIFWEEMFAALTEYRENHGDCLVPEEESGQSQLAWWVGAQRKAKLAEQLEPERIHRLDAIGFIWDVQEVIWQASFRELTAFHKRFGHCIVPAEWPENPRLATWVMTQRNARSKGLLGAKRDAALTSLGMIWDPKEAIAEEMMLQLAAFMALHGHCDVPLDHREYPRLGMWVQFQRQAKKDGTLNPVRAIRLEEIGLVWK